MTLFGKLSFSWPKSAEQTATNHYDADYQPLFKFGYGLTYQDKVMIENTLDETVQTTHNKLSTLTLFAGAAKMPWQMRLTSGAERSDITSSKQTLGAITLQTLDKTVQEDARRISFDGTELAHVSLVSNFPEDLRAYIESNATLNFSLRVNSEIKDEVGLAMVCEQDCQGSLALSEYLRPLAASQWHDAAIDLQCFNKRE